MPVAARMTYKVAFVEEALTDKLWIKFDETLCELLVVPKEIPITLPVNELYVLDRLYIVFPVMVLLAFVPPTFIPLTAAVFEEELLALAMVKLKMALLEIVFIEEEEAIPLISPLMLVVELVVLLVRLAIVSLLMARMPPLV